MTDHHENGGPIADAHAAAHRAGRARQLPIEETERLIASDKVEGTAVFDRDGNGLGTVAGVMIDKFTGKVAYVVMSFGGFLGIGERYHPLPWRILDYDPRRGGFVIDVTRERMERAPSYEAAVSPWSDPAFGRSVYDYYSIPWYM